MLKSKALLISLVAIAVVLALAITQTSNTSANSGIEALINKNISFPGYCDGMYISANTSSGLAGGMRTGCASEVLAGTVADIYSHGTGVALSWTHSSGTAFHTVVIANPKKWYHYVSDGQGGVVLINTGDWTEGAPTLTGNEDLPSSTN